MQPFVRRKLINVLKCAKSSKIQCSWNKDSVCNVLPFVKKGKGSKKDLYLHQEAGQTHYLWGGGRNRVMGPDTPVFTFPTALFEP